MDMGNLLAKAQNIQKQISAAQELLSQKRVKGISGNGMVVVTMTGKYDLISVTINPDILSHDAKTVSDLVADAYRDAKNKADILIDNVMTKASGGIQLN